MKALTTATWLSGRLGVPMQEHSRWAQTLHCCAWSLSRRYCLSHQVTWSLGCHGHVLSWLKSGMASLLLGPSKCAWLCLNPRLAQLRAPLEPLWGASIPLFHFLQNPRISVLLSPVLLAQGHTANQQLKF